MTPLPVIDVRLLGMRWPEQSVSVLALHQSDHAAPLFSPKRTSVVDEIEPSRRRAPARLRTAAVRTRSPAFEIGHVKLRRFVGYNTAHFLIAGGSMTPGSWEPGVSAEPWQAVLNKHGVIPCARRIA